MGQGVCSLAKSRLRWSESEGFDNNARDKRRHCNRQALIARGSEYHKKNGERSANEEEHKAMLSFSGWLEKWEIRIYVIISIASRGLNLFLPRRLWSELWGSLRGQLSVHDWWDRREGERKKSIDE